MIKIKKTKYIVCSIFVVLIGLIFTGRLINWQVIQGKEYDEIAANADSYKEIIPAARGEIYDKNGLALAVNTAGYDIQVTKAHMQPNSENSVIETLLNIFEEKNENFIDKLPIEIDDDGNYVFSKNCENDIEQLKAFYKFNQNASANDCMNTLIKKYSCENYKKDMQRNIISVRYNMEKEGFNDKTPYTFASAVKKEIVEAVSENFVSLKCVKVKTTPKREYPDPESASQIIGTVGSITKEEYENKNKDGNNNYKLNSKIGKTGIEAAFEDNLKGKDGISRVSNLKVNSNSDTDEKTLQDAENGDKIYLTIDKNLQLAALNALKTNCEEAQKSAKANEVVTGSIVAIDLSDFSVLCAQSYPNFDLNKYYTDKKYYNQIVSDDTNKPLFNRAFEGCYAIGSTMKPAVAVAALEEGVIDENTKFRCNHVYTKFAPNYMPKCLGTHGNINLSEALAESCNIYFFETADRLGITKMNEYQKNFGLGEKTGVEINEKTGVLAGPQERQASGGTWYDGDTITAAIGQSDNLITPIQLATYCATIANNGVRYKTHLIKKITSFDQTQTKLENKQDNPTIIKDMQLSSKTINNIKADMRGVVTKSEGTAHNTLGSYKIPIAAKTGTAQVTANNSSHTATDTATLIAFAPYNDPKIAVGIVMEYTKTGVYPANILKTVLDEYFKS